MRTSNHKAARVWRRVRCAWKRRGAFLPVAALSLAAASAMVALGVDLSVVTLERTKMQNACDAAALAASQEITSAVATAAEDSTGSSDVAGTVQDANAIATAAAKTMAQKVAALNGVYVDPERDVTFGKRVFNSQTGKFSVEWGVGPYNVVKVTARRDNPEPGHQDSTLDLFFAGVTGQGSASLTTSAVAYVEARDIAMVMDFSGSMNDDSTMAAYNRLGKSNVEANQQEIWEALAVQGSLPFTPEYLTVSKSSGQVTASNTFKNTQVTLSSNKPYQSVKLTFTNNNTQTFSNLSTSSGTYQGSSSNNGKSIKKVELNATYDVVDTSEPSTQLKNGLSPTNSYQAQIKVYFKGTSLTVTSTKSISNVVLRFADNTDQMLTSSLGGTLKGTGSNAGKWIKQCYVRSGTRTSTDGTNYGEKITNPHGSDWPTNEETAALTFELTGAELAAKYGLGTYPWASGSWDEFMSFCNSNSAVNNNGHRYKYGGLTMVEFLLTQKQKQNQTKDLWKTPHYPFHAMKEGASLFCEFLTGLEFGDELGMVDYAEEGTIETSQADLGDGVTVNLGTDWITSNYEGINQIQRHKQAGNYTDYTNIAAGIVKGKELLTDHIRYGARPTMFLMTDGQANREVSGWSLPAGWDWNKLTDYDGDGQADYSTSDSAKLCALVKAKECVDAGITIHTLAIGADADRDLMKAIAFMGKGQFISAPGGATIDTIHAQLLTAFGKIAAQVPPAKLLVIDED
ncbi:MAG: hypothetical protein IT428_01085 [Planctomycetaceae bacterium]|nr:hypothetical protein [Planctomycetaceae bacterium]